MRIGKAMLMGWVAMVLMAAALPADTYVWTQTNRGTFAWSDTANWSNNAAPPSGGASNAVIQILTNAMPLAGGFSQTKNNDLGGDFNLNSLIVNGNGTGSSNIMAGGALTFVADGAAAPKLKINATGNNNAFVNIYNDLNLNCDDFVFESASSPQINLYGNLGGTGNWIFARAGSYATLWGVKTFVGDVVVTNGGVTLRGTNLFTGNVTVRNGATLTLGAIGSNNNYRGSTTIDPGGVLIVNAGSGVWTNDVLNNGQLRYAGANGIYTFSGPISGSGVLQVDAGGTVMLSLTNVLNPFVGKTEIRQGGVTIDTIGDVNGGLSSLGNPDSVSNGTINLGNSSAVGTLKWIGGAGFSDRVINLSGTSGGGVIDASGTGALALTATNLTATGAGSKTLTLQGSSTNDNTIQGRIVDNSPANTTTLSKDGTGTWVLGATNGYTGRTLINGGVLRMDSTNSLGAGNLKFYALGIAGILETTTDFARPSGSGAGQVTLGDSGNARNGGFSAKGGDISVAIGALDAPESITWGNSPGTFNVTTFFLNSIVADGALDFKNPINLNGAARTINVGASTAILSSNLTGTGASGLTKTGAGILILRGSNTYAGATTVDGAGGTLKIDSAVALPATTGTLAVKAGTLDFNGYNVTMTRPIALGGSPGTARILMNGGTLTLATNLTYDAAASNLALIDGAIDLGATDRIFIVNNNASADPDLEISAPIGGTGGLVKQGAGTLLLSGDNGYLGRTRIDHGVIRMGHLNALGDTTNPTRIEGIGQGAYLDFNGLGTAGNPITEPLELVYNNTDYIGNSSTNPAYHNAPIVVTTRGHIFGTGMFTLAGPITGSGFWQMQNNGTVILEGPTNPATTFNMGGNSSAMLPNLRLKINAAASMPSGITIQQGVFDLTAADTLLRTGGQIYFNPNTAGSVGSVETGSRLLTLEKNATIDVKDQTTVAVGGPFVVSGNISLGTNTASWKLGRSNPDMTNTLVCPYDFDLQANVSAATSGVGITFDYTYANQPGIVRLTGSNTFSGTLTINRGQTVMFDSIGNANGGASALGNPVTAANSLYIGSGNAAGLAPAFRYIGTAPAGHASNRSIYDDANTDTSLRIIADGLGPLNINGGGTGVTFSTRGAGGTKTLVLGGSNTGANVFGAILAATPGQVALVKEGPGTWILNSRLSSYTNLTTIRGGKLLVNGVLGNTVSGVICTNGGTLGGTGAVYRPVLVAAGATTNAGGRVAPGAGVGAFTVGDGASPRSFTFEASTNAAWRPGWDVDLSSSGCDMIVVNGDFVMPATGQVTLTVTNADAMSPRYKTYVLMTWTGADPAGDASRFALNLLPANWRGGTVTVDKTANEVRLSGITQPAGTLIMVQ